MSIPFYIRGTCMISFRIVIFLRWFSDSPFNKLKLADVAAVSEGSSGRARMAEVDEVGFQRRRGSSAWLDG